MQLAAGHRLGPYEILGPVGAGGMGEVYRGRDTRLNRTVAIKILPTAAARDETHRSRFAREAKAISSLAHPNICTLYDVGSESGVDYLVMELLEGETLAERLRKGPLPLETLLRYGVAIADALEKAHATGVIHRDLKPANMMITKSGVKLLDFGVADLLPSHDPSPDAATWQGNRERLTGAGMVMGTPDFMAPEQIEGRQSDERTDIFALGNVLYRMAAGRAPFQGTGDAGVASGILYDEPPPIRDRRPEIPPALERLIFDCLRKDPAERMQSAHDVKLQLESIADSDRSERKSGRRGWLPWAVGAAAVLATAVVMQTIDSRRAMPPAGVRRFSIQLPEMPAAYDWANREMAISPDGSRVVVSMNFEGRWRMYVREFDSAQLTALPGTDEALSPFFSPDGQWIGFTSGGKLKKMLLSGGSPVTIADAPRPRGASWGRDGTIVFTPVSSGQGLFEVSADGGPTRPITTLGRNELTHRWPHVLPDPRYVLYSIDDWGADYDRKKVAILDRESGETRVLIEGGCDPRYVDGYLLFARERSLHAVRFDPERMAISGLPTPVVNGVTTHVGVGSMSADVSTDGTLVYVPYDPAGDERSLMWVDRTGAAEALAVEPHPYWSPRLSPDQSQLVVGVGESRATDLWLLDLSAASWSRIAEAGKSLAPIWSNDGGQIFFSSNREGPYNIYVMNSDGTGSPRRVTDRQHWPFSRAVSPDGGILLAEEQHPVTSYDIWQVRTDGGGGAPLIADPLSQNHPDFSPDGKWIVYHSTESGRSAIYVQQFPPSGRKWTVSEGVGIRPRWSKRGDEIFFSNGRQMLAAAVSTTPTVSIGKPRVLFEGDYAAEYDVSADAQRFLMLRPSARARETRLAVVLGWPAELERLTAASDASDR